MSQKIINFVHTKPITPPLTAPALPTWQQEAIDQMVETSGKNGMI